MDFDFREFLVSKGFEKTTYPNNITSFSYEVEKEEKPHYFSITIHSDNLITCAASEKDGLFSENELLPENEEIAEKYLDEFLN